mmetsp:Transcript_3151/g.10448  ORF Transcript_3151/g.10448 Transcript_3151/m.10448 type:complete len:247 (-) Transcript_3151:317-1057(-)
MACSLSQSSNPPPRRRNLLSFFGIFFAEMSRVVGAFVGMLEQKLQVLEAVGATTAYTSVCPLVGASVGQHVSRVARKVCCFFVKLPRCTRCGIPWTTARGRRRRWRRSRRAPRDVGAVWRCEVTATRAALLAYDVRRRGGGAETDAAAAADVVVRARDGVVGALSKDPSLLHADVVAQFATSAEQDSFHDVPSTIQRELSFVSHHAYHHLAMIRLVAIHHLKIPEAHLPAHLGRAPATIIFDRHGT